VHPREIRLLFGESLHCVSSFSGFLRFRTSRQNNLSLSFAILLSLGFLGSNSRHFLCLG
jgi:hypothetical protein